MATHSSVPAWRTPGTGGLPSVGSHRVGHDRSDLAAAAAAAAAVSKKATLFFVIFLCKASQLRNEPAIKKLQNARESKK